jgi:hypothetical protein
MRVSFVPGSRSRKLYSRPSLPSAADGTKPMSDQLCFAAGAVVLVPALDDIAMRVHFALRAPGELHTAGYPLRGDAGEGDGDVAVVTDAGDEGVSTSCLDTGTVVVLHYPEWR